MGAARGRECRRPGRWCGMRTRSAPEHPPGPRPPSAQDLEALRHVAQDADGEPLPDDALAFLAEAVGDVLRLDADRLCVLGVAGVRHYPACAVRAALADARAVWAVVGGGG